MDNKMTAANSEGTAGAKSFGRPFPKGKSGNPTGRPKLTPTQAEAKAAVLDAIARLALMPRKDIEALMAGNPIGAEIIALNLVLSGKNVGEALDRIVGPVPKSTELRGDGGGPVVLKFVPFKATPEAPEPPEMIK